MIESMCAGVPMACWPFYGDQLTNSRYACAELGTGIEIDNEGKREEVEKIVNELMEGEKAKEMRNKVLLWKQNCRRSYYCCCCFFLRHLGEID
ncbi:hypothetical protein K1719_007439 [Acacia pycnantha]|nr:hypothetical protein K1719_007439 [Acacia pycnantha]